MDNLNNEVVEDKEIAEDTISLMKQIVETEKKKLKYIRFISLCILTLVCIAIVIVIRL